MHSKLTWMDECLERPIDERSNAQQFSLDYRPRKPHAKSRNGCKNCKKRKIKCDESKPECGQCLHRHVRCDITDFKPVQANIKSISASAGQRPTPPSILISQLLDMLEQTNIPWSEFKIPIYRRDDARDILDHFLKTSIPWLGPPSFQKVIQESGLRLALRAPYLLHAILTISATHLTYLYPAERKYHIASTLHYDQFLMSYTSRIQQGIDVDNADLVIGCCYLQTILTFENIHKLSRELEASLSCNKNGSCWVRAIRGIPVLQADQTICPHLTQSIWLPVLLESSSCKGFTCEHAREVDGSWASTTCRTLHLLCKESPVPTVSGSPYHRALGRLCQLMQSDMDHSTIGKFLTLIGELPDDFYRLLETYNAPAMLLIAYWCALISRVDQWWIVVSAKTECKSICAYLDGVEDPQIRSLLKFPASRCGYILQT